MGEPGFVGSRGFCSDHVSQPFVVTDSQLECLAAGVVNGEQVGNINQVGLCSAANEVDNVTLTFDVQGFSTLLNETRKRSRDTMTTCDNVDGGGCFSLKRERQKLLAQVMLLAGVVDSEQARNINHVDLCLATNVVHNVNPTFDVHGFSRMDDTKISGTSLNETRKRTRDATTVCDNVDGSGCSLSTRQCMSVDHGNMYLTTTQTDFVLAGGPFSKTGSSSHMHVSVISSYTNKKHTRVVTSTTTATDVRSSSLSTRRCLTSDNHSINALTLNDDPVFPADSSNGYTNASGLPLNRECTRGVTSTTTIPDVGSSSSSRRRCLSFGRRSFNASTLNNDPVFPVDSSNAHTNGSHFHDNRTGPPLNRERTRGVTSITRTPDVGSSSSSRRRCFSSGRRSLNASALNNDPVFPVYSFNAHTNGSHFHDNRTGPPLNSERIRGVTSTTRTPDVGSSSSSRRRCLSSGRRSLNASTSNNDPVFPVDSSNAHTNGSHFHDNCTGPPLEYKHIGSCNHSSKHYGVVFGTENVSKTLEEEFVLYMFMIRKMRWTPYDLPSKEIDPEGHRVVAEFMIRGPCGEVCSTAAFAKKYAHINVEHCGWTMLIKYLFKYISKGTDRIATRVARDNVRDNTNTASSSRQPQIAIDEIKNYLDSRKSSIVASSGIASLLLPSGRTAHSRFKLPLDLNDSSMCPVTKNTQLAALLKETYLVIWDESLMNDRRCFETLDRTLRDILATPNKLFGGKSIMLGGDFRQTLPVKKSASRTDTTT
ncbi:DNA helicase [Tanacetum coccineum]